MFKHFSYFVILSMRSRRLQLDNCVDLQLRLNSVMIAKILRLNIVMIAKIFLFILILAYFLYVYVSILYHRYNSYRNSNYELTTTVKLKNRTPKHYKIAFPFQMTGLFENRKLFYRYRLSVRYLNESRDVSQVHCSDTILTSTPSKLGNVFFIGKLLRITIGG